MTDACPDLTYDMIVRLDHGQFGIYGGYRSDVDHMELLTRAMTAAGIATFECGVVVLSPHQNNFRMPLRVEVWPGRPPDDGNRWEEVAESTLTIEGGELRYESPTNGGTASCAVPDGRYGVRICGRGFVNRGWPGSTEPGDDWRVQLWPATDEVVDQRIKTWRPA